MGFYATTTECTCREKMHPPSKNRVWGFSATSRNRAWKSTSQVLEPQQENQPTPTTTASGVHYYGLRYYSLELGRWINRDPIGERGGLNVYVFAKNSPVALYDLLGLWTPECCEDECPEKWRNNFRRKTAILGPVNPISQDLLDFAQLFAGVVGAIPTGVSPSELISYLLQQGLPSGQLLSTYVNLIINGLPWYLYVVFEVDICEKKRCRFLWWKNRMVTRKGTHRCTIGGNLPGGSWLPGTDLVDDVSNNNLQQCIDEAEIEVLGGGGTLWP